MKLYYPAADVLMDFSGTAVPSLVIESPRAFLSFLQDIQQQLEGGEGELVLSVRDKPVDMSRYAETISTFVPFEINRKTLINKIVGWLEKKAVDSEHYLQTQKLLTDIELFVDELAADSPCDIISDKISIGPILKAVGIELRDDYDNLAEKLLDYMELVREFDRDRLFILINSRAYFDQETMELFLQTAIAHGYRLLLVDSHADVMLSSEQRITVDKELCVF